jgi:hypothetical protein
MRLLAAEIRHHATAVALLRRGDPGRAAHERVRAVGADDEARRTRGLAQRQDAMRSTRAVRIAASDDLGVEHLPERILQRASSTIQASSGTPAR